MKKLKVSVKWGKQQLGEPSYQQYEVIWLRETTLRQLLVHIVNMVDGNLSLDSAEVITLHVVDITSSGGKRKRILGRTCATDLLDDVVYAMTMNDCSSREFIFEVQAACSVGPREVVNVFNVLLAKQSILVLLPPHITQNNNADDMLHNDILI